MTSISLSPDSRGYTYAAIKGFLDGGWTLRTIPDRGHLLQNRQLVQLAYSGRAELFRLMIYTVSESGRGRSFERRIQITSTYAGGRLRPEENVEDVVLGYDPVTGVFVGFDARRLHHGGPTENASAFIDVEELRLGSEGQIVISPRSSELFGLEYHAFFRPHRLAEYIVNRSLIHFGAYSGGGEFSNTHESMASVGSFQVDRSESRGATVVLVEPADASSEIEPDRHDLESVETGQIERLRSRKVTPEQLEMMLRVAARNGATGEFEVMKDERKRLMRAGQGNLARKIRWTSKENVAAGFDISSFEVDGSPRLIEVKSSSSETRQFIISRNEWMVAQAKGEQYWIYLVTNVNSNPQIVRLQNPVRLEREGQLVRTANEWIVRSK